MKIFSLLLFLMSFQTFAVDCTTLWRAGFPDQGRQRTPFSCSQISLTNPNIKLYASDQLTPSTQLDQLKSTVSEALIKSYTSYASLGAMPKVKAVMYHRPHFNDNPPNVITYAMAILQFVSRSESCPVIIYPTALNFNSEDMKQLIAHELFHCYQWKNNNAQVMLGSAQGIGIWWLEGIAQFMSNHVYPKVDLEYDPIFSNYRPRDPLTAQDGYSNAHFFQSFVNSLGIRDLLNFMSSMPSTASGNQVAALGSIDNIAQVFHRYARSMIIPTLLDSSGRTSRLNTIFPMDQFTVENLGSTFTKELSITPYSIHNITFTLPAGYNYKIKVESEADVRMSIRNYDEEIWNELPFSHDTACEFPETYELVVSATPKNLNKVMANLVIESEERMDCPCTSTQVDQCMVGNWELDPQSMRSFVDQVIGTQAEVTNVAGYEKMSIDRNGHATMDFNWFGEGKGDMGGTPAELKMIMKGTQTVDIFKKQPGMYCAHLIERNVKSVLLFTARGMSYTFPINGSVFDTNQSQPYRCNNREYVVEIHIPAGDGRPDPIDLEWKYLRR